MEVNQGIALVNELAKLGVNILDQRVEARTHLVERVGVVGGPTGQLELDRLDLRQDFLEIQADGLGLSLLRTDGAIPGRVRSRARLGLSGSAAERGLGPARDLVPKIGLRPDRRGTAKHAR